MVNTRYTPGVVDLGTRYLNKKQFLQIGFPALLRKRPIIKDNSSGFNFFLLSGLYLRQIQKGPNDLQLKIFTERT